MSTPPLPDAYATLGVTAGASSDELLRAFRDLVREHHPDTRRPASSEFDDDLRLQQILTAYATLRDPVRRAAYDRVRPATASTPPTPQPRSPATPVSAPIRVGPGTRRGGPEIRVGPAIRVGPVHWKPLAQPTPPRDPPLR
ncbi:J domain-containing protein [Kribbella sp. NPDC023972]|uniref:J domain-containing protein n=1 Tax=Kribbella sp. NPDC023972 TaxID=3154795 RepID=UPI00340695AE